MCKIGAAMKQQIHNT